MHLQRQFLAQISVGRAQVHPHSFIIMLLNHNYIINIRRKDEAHDIGDSSPGTTGDSRGTFHDRIGSGQTFTPDSEKTMSEEEVDEYLGNARIDTTSEESNGHQNEPRQQRADTEKFQTKQESGEESKRMKYAKRYGDSWPSERQERFLRAHDVSVREVGWKLKE